MEHISGIVEAVMKYIRDGNVELLFVAGSSQDRRGRRVLVREYGTENWIYPNGGVSDVDMRLLGLTPEDRERIEQFFEGHNGRFVAGVETK